MDNNEVKCPKCGSNQITAGKKGFSLGKAAGGILLTGGIGALAGLHGSNNVEAICLSCGSKWNPAKRFEEEKLKEQQRQKDHEKIWKNNYYKAIENGNENLANEIMKRENPNSMYGADLKQTYNNLKKQDESNVTFNIIVMIIFGCFILFVVSKFT
jgi:tellurium resistance protein TerD